MNNQFLLQPTSEYISLLSTLVYLMLMFHLPYLGMVLGSSVLSAAYNKFDRSSVGEALGVDWFRTFAGGSACLFIQDANCEYACTDPSLLAAIIGGGSSGLYITYNIPSHG